MTIRLAMLLPGLLLLLGGTLLVLATNWASALLKRFPRSPGCAYLFFGPAALWFLYKILNLTEADFGDQRVIIFIVFGMVGALAFKLAPEFLAVRGLCALMLLAATPLLDAGYMKFDFALLYLQRTLVYVGICLAIWAAAQPWRVRDFLDWLYQHKYRAKATGSLLLIYGLLLCGGAFLSTIKG